MFKNYYFRIIIKNLTKCNILSTFVQRWSPRGRPLPRGRSRGHILKSLASKPQVLENCPVLGSRSAPFFEPLKFCWKPPEISRKICEDLFLFYSSGDRLKKNLGRLFLFWRKLAPVSSVLGHERVCPWPRALCPRLHLYFRAWKLWKNYRP